MSSNTAEMTVKPLTKFEQDLLARTKASYQVIHLCSPELVRAEEMLRNVARELTKNVEEAAHRKMMLITWDSSNGFTTAIGRDRGENYVPDSLKDAKYLNPILALDAITPDVNGVCKVGASNDHLPKRCVFAFLDFDDYLKDARVRTKLAHLSARQRLVSEHARHPLFIISAASDMDNKLKPYVSLFDVPLPDRDELRIVHDHLLAQLDSQQQQIVRPSEDETMKIIDNLAGMTALEAENVLARCLVQFRTLANDGVLPIIKKEKANIIRKSEVLTYIPEEHAGSLDNLCGFDGYIEWLRRRKLSYGAAAKAHNIDTPRGVAVIGCPGTAKSMVAKATCLELGLPGYIMDIGALFGSMVGESEKRVRDVLRILDAQQGCVLVIDEADKALGNAHQSTGDSGVTRRVFGQILTWLAENQSRTFVIMTLNRTDGIPPETLRAGRFDKMFYTDLPDAEVRRQIFEVHFRKRGVDPVALGFKEATWQLFVEKTDQFVGSEIEEVVREARHMAMSAHGNGVPTLEHMMEAIAGIKPLAATSSEEITKIREFCKKNGAPVTGKKVEEVAAGTKPPRKSRGRGILLNDDTSAATPSPEE